MTTLTWKETPPVWTALLDDAPVCPLKGARTSAAGRPAGRESGCGLRPRSCPRPGRKRRGLSCAWTGPSEGGGGSGTGPGL